MTVCHTDNALSITGQGNAFFLIIFVNPLSAGLNVTIGHFFHFDSHLHVMQLPAGNSDCFFIMIAHVVGYESKTDIQTELI